MRCYVRRPPRFIAGVLATAILLSEHGRALLTWPVFLSVLVDL